MIDDGRNNDEYKKWRAAVKKRDKNKCRWPECKKRAKEVHHILPYSVALHLRTDVENGICLCLAHHKAIKNKEIYYIDLFISILKNGK